MPQASQRSVKQSRHWGRMSLVGIALAFLPTFAEDATQPKEGAPAGLSIRFPAAGASLERSDASRRVVEEDNSTEEPAEPPIARTGTLRPARIAAVRNDVRPPKASKLRPTSTKSATALQKQGDPFAVHVETNLPASAQSGPRSSRRTASTASGAGMASASTLRPAEVVPLGEDPVESPLTSGRAKRKPSVAETARRPPEGALRGLGVTPSLTTAPEPITAEYVEEVAPVTESEPAENFAPIIDAADMPRPTGQPRSAPAAAPRSAAPNANTSSGTQYPSTSTPGALKFASSRRPSGQQTPAVEPSARLEPPAHQETAANSKQLVLRRIAPVQSESEPEPLVAAVESKAGFASLPYLRDRQMAAAKMQPSQSPPSMLRNDPKLQKLPQLIAPPKLQALPNSSAFQDSPSSKPLSTNAANTAAPEEKPAELLVRQIFAVAEGE